MLVKNILQTHASLLTLDIDFICLNKLTIDLCLADVVSTVLGRQDVKGQFSWFCLSVALPSLIYRALLQPQVAERKKNEIGLVARLFNLSHTSMGIHWIFETTWHVCGWKVIISTREIRLETGLCDKLYIPNGSFYTLGFLCLTLQDSSLAIVSALQMQRFWPIKPHYKNIERNWLKWDGIIEYIYYIVLTKHGSDLYCFWVHKDITSVLQMNTAEHLHWVLSFNSPPQLSCISNHRGLHYIIKEREWIYAT